LPTGVGGHRQEVMTMRTMAGCSRWRWIVGIAALGPLLFLAGCGSEADPSGASPDEPASPTTIDVEVFFTNDRLGDPCDEVFGVSRSVSATDPLTGAIEALLTGPDEAEREEGYGGWFSQDTAGMLRSARLDENLVRIDFDDLRPVIPNASTSCGSSALLAQLDSTAFAVVPEATGTRYAIEGEQAAFYEWLQRAVPGQELDQEPAQPPPDDAAKPKDGATEKPGAGHEPTDDDGRQRDRDDHGGESAALEDGRHASYLHGLDVDARTITVDVVQFLTGQAATEAYQQDNPDDPDGPPNDYYIVNANPRLRTLPVASDVEVRLVRLHEGGGTDLTPGTWEELPTYLDAYPTEDARLSWNPFWITVHSGEVTAMEEQYIP
jgi:hypothetical protein